jgi:putative serine protease PepD
MPTPSSQGSGPQGRSGLSILSLGGWIMGGLALAAVVWTQFRPRPELPPPAPAAAAAAPPASAALPAPSSLQAPARTASLEEVVSKGIGAVVVVETSRGRGSGFFVSPDTLLTNFHVVNGSSYVTIRRSGGETATAFVGATASDYDLAVLKLSGPASDHQVTLPLGSAASLRAGQEVIAIGSPLGLQNSVTRGIVSSVRQMGLVTVVQTDAAINHGNSGGPLLDRSGNAIGINTFILNNSSVPGVLGGSQGMNFAVSIDHAKALLEGRPPAEGALAQAAGNTLDRPAAVSETESQQTAGSRLYEARLAQLAQAADTLDQAWTRLLANGYQGRVEGSFEHGWYALWVDGALQGSVLRGYETTIGQIRTNADTIRRLSITADEDARQAGVLPGVRRELRQKYRLDNPGWGL